MIRRRIAVVVLGLAVLGAGCASEKHGTRDAPINTSLQDNQAPFIINMPDGFMNMALKCVGTDLVIAHTRIAAPVVVPGAALCAEGAANGIARVKP